jgi:hypothetical protein
MPTIPIVGHRFTLLYKELFGEECIGGVTLGQGGRGDHLGVGIDSDMALVLALVVLSSFVDIARLGINGGDDPILDETVGVNLLIDEINVSTSDHPKKTNSTKLLGSTRGDGALLLSARKHPSSLVCSISTFAS